MKKVWKIGIIYNTSHTGRGHHGTHFSFTGLPGVEISLADPNTNNLTPRMKEIGASRHHANYLDLLDVERPDIVVICSRVPTDHCEIIEAAARRGCHIHCEKPLTASLREADRIIALAQEHNVKISVAHLARHALVFRTVQKMIRNGDIGTPLTFYGRGKEDERGGGEDMMVLGTHIFDLGVFLFGTPEYVSADVSSNGRPITKESRNDTSEPVGPCAGDSIFAHFRFAGGVNGIFESRKDLCVGPVRMGITVVGTSGMISVRYDNDRALRLCRSPLPPEDESHFEEVELHEDRVIPPGAAPLDYAHYGPEPSRYFADNNRFAALDLMQAITEDRPPIASAHDARTVLEMMAGIYGSHVYGRRIRFPLTNREHPLESEWSFIA